MEQREELPHENVAKDEDAAAALPIAVSPVEQNIEFTQFLQCLYRALPEPGDPRLGGRAPTRESGSERIVRVTEDHFIDKRGDQGKWLLDVALAGGIEGPPNMAGDVSPKSLSLLGHAHSTSYTS